MLIMFMNNKTNKAFSVLVAILAILVTLSPLSVFAVQGEAPVTQNLYIDNVNIAMPMIRGENGAIVVFPCEHSCIQCGMCTADTPCNTVGDVSVRCTCENPVLPVFTTPVFRSTDAGLSVKQYSMDPGAMSLYYGNLRSAIDYRYISDVYIIDGLTGTGSRTVTITLDKNSSDKLKDNDLVLYWINKTKSEKITDFKHDAAACTVEFSVKNSGAYVLAEHWYNICLVSDATFYEDATCDLPARYKMTCDCGKICPNGDYTFYSGDPKGHEFTVDKVIENATCQTAGVQELVCSVCGYEEDGEIPIRGHYYKNLRLVKAPSTEEEGKTACDCEYCGAVYNDVVPRITEDTIVPTDDSTVSKKTVTLLVVLVAVLWVAQLAIAVVMFKKKNKKEG